MAVLPGNVHGCEIRSTNKYRLFASHRFLILSLLFICAFVVNANFYSLNFAITCMVNSTYQEEDTRPSARDGGNRSSGSGKCIAARRSQTREYQGTFLWDRRVQSALLAAEGIGAVWFILLTGWMLDRYGAKWLYFGSLMLLALMSFLIPVSAHLGWQYLFAARFLQGIGMEVCWPATFYVINRWFPAHELGVVSALAVAGFQAASLFTMSISGYFCDSSLGWEGIFYFLGFISVLGAVIWIIFYSNDVSHARWISAAEVAHIKRHRSAVESNSSRVIPFRAIFTSFPVWAIVVMNFCCFYVFYFVGDYIPTYFKEVLSVRSGENGIMTALPFLSQLAGQNISGVESDFLTKRFGATIAVKLNTALCGFGAAVFLTVLPIFDCTRAWYAVACLVGAYFFYGFALGGFMRSCCLVAPRFTGTITGLCTTATYISGIVAPYATGAMTPNGTLPEWRTTFYAASGIISFGTIFFLLFGSGEPQPWSRTEDDEKAHISVISYK